MVIAAQHNPDVSNETIREGIIEEVIKKIIPAETDGQARRRSIVNSTGRFVVGGPKGDCGMTGQKDHRRHVRRGGKPRRRRIFRQGPVQDGQERVLQWPLFPFVSLLPAWAVDVLGGNVRTNGLLYSAHGLGALIAAIGIAALGRFTFRGKLLNLGLFLFPSLMILFSFLRWLPLSLLVLVGVGGALVIVMNLANSLVQTGTEDSVRGSRNKYLHLSIFWFFAPWLAVGRPNRRKDK